MHAPRTPFRRLAPLLFLALPAAFFDLACHKSEATASADKPAARPATKVTLAPATKASIPDDTSVTGTILADREAMVAADAIGKVLEIAVQRGAVVKKGDILARLDTRGANFTAEMARAQAKVADSQAAIAKTECDRSDTLFASGAISAAEHDRALATCRTASAQVQAASASASMAAKTLGDGVIRAPFSGTVGERFVQIGEYVQAQSKVVSLYAVDPLRIEIAIPERIAGSVKSGTKLDFTTTAFGDKKFQAEVRFVSPVLRRETRDMVVEAIVANTEGQLKPGMFSTVRVGAGDRNVIAVPKTAIRGAAPNGSVFVIANGLAEEHLVRFQEVTKESYILEGLTEATNVVDAPAITLRDGDPIAP
jgi:membrane fusion protein (multidrug efflux system)